MKIYNADLLRNKKKFTTAILLGILTSLGCGLVIGLYDLINPISISFTPVLYVLAAYVISKIIYEFGDGIGNKYAVVSILCFILCLIASKMFLLIFIYGFHIQLFSFYIQVAFGSYLNFSWNNIISIICIAYGFYICYYNSRMA